MEITRAYGIIGIFSVILGLAKEIITIVLLVKGIQVANIYINKNRDEKLENSSQDMTENFQKNNHVEETEIESQDIQIKDNENDKY
ncbi:MAG: hypothetical protein GX023_06960 [Tissierellia bacterium]|nr:hypothetical protein [Tissierellia bacterium]